MQKNLRWDQVYASDKDFKPVSKLYLMELIETITKERGKSIARVLDLGCGTGDLAIKFAQLGLHVKAVDVSPVALEKAKDKAAELNLLDRIEFECADIETESISGKYDLILMKLVFAFMEDKDRMIQRIQSALTAQGYFVLITPVLLPSIEYSQRLKTISVDRKEIETLLNKYFLKSGIFYKEYFEDVGLELTFLISDPRHN